MKSGVPRKMTCSVKEGIRKVKNAKKEDQREEAKIAISVTFYEKT